MPNITIQGVSKEFAKEISNDMSKFVSEESKVGVENVKVFYSPVVRLDGEEEIAIDIYWMERPQEVCDKIASRMTEYLRERGYDELIQITFTEFVGNRFYHNGVHY
ncbi:MAG: DUF1904 family protein [Tissierellia bacterium]|nr:DUF1904 family protein [Tissierellia bacterium]